MKAWDNKEWVFSQFLDFKYILGHNEPTDILMDGAKKNQNDSLKTITFIQIFQFDYPLLGITIVKWF